MGRNERNWTQPTVWLNPRRKPARDALPALAVTAAGFAAFDAVSHALGLADATHVIWTTGGSFLPDEKFTKVLETGSEEAGQRRPA